MQIAHAAMIEWKWVQRVVVFMLSVVAVFPPAAAQVASLPPSPEAVTGWTFVTSPYAWLPRIWTTLGPDRGVQTSRELWLWRLSIGAQFRPDVRWRSPL